MRSFTFIALASVVLFSSVTVNANETPVVWNKATLLNNMDFTNYDLTDRTSGVVFIRPKSGNPPSSAVNIAINDEFLSSVQDGYYTSATVCTLGTRLSAYPTSAKSNDLLANAQVMDLKAGQVNFFEIVVNPGSAPYLRRVDSAMASQLLNGTHRQSHQISRVHTPSNCQVPYQPVATGLSQERVIVSPNPYQPAPPVRQQVQVGYETDPNLRLNILFDHDKSDLKPMYQSEITRAADFLSNYPNMDALVEGHTDSNGDAKYNQILSQRRAETVRQALIKNHNVDPSRLKAVGYGEARPIADNSTREGRQENRRVIISIPKP